MLAFSAKWIQPIVTGKKNVTFRRWPNARVKEGGVYDAVTIGFPRKTFAKVRVIGVRKIKLGEIDNTLAKRDGVTSLEEVRSYWTKQGFDMSKQLWLVEFEVQKSSK